MTTIAGYRDPDGTIWLGSDSLVSSGAPVGFRYPEQSQKIQRIDKWTIAHTGSSRLDIDIPRWLESGADSPIEVARKIFAGFAADGYKRCEHEGAPCYHSDVIITDGVGLWIIGGAGSVAEPRWNFLAAGSGESFAYGAAWILANLKSPIGGEYLVWSAIQAAMEFDSATGGEINVVRCSSSGASLDHR